MGSFCILYVACFNATFAMRIREGKMVHHSYSGSPLFLSVEPEHKPLHCHHRFGFIDMEENSPNPAIPVWKQQLSERPEEIRQSVTVLPLLSACAFQAVILNITSLETPAASAALRGMQLTCTCRNAVHTVWNHILQHTRAALPNASGETTAQRSH